MTNPPLPQNQIYRLLVQAVQDYAIFALDPKGHIQTWNEGAKRLKGYTADEVIGSHFSLFYSKEDRTRNHPDWELQQATKYGTYEEEGWRLRKDGSRFWVSVTITALRDEQGHLQGFGKVTRDLTQKRLAEEELRQSEERFRLMIEGVKDYAIFALDPQGFVATWNDGAERNKGYTAYEIIGEHFSKFYPEEDKRQKKPEFELLEAARVGRFEDTGWRVRKDGTTFWANVIITAMKDNKGRLVGFSKVTRDLTEKKLAEDKLLSYNANLEQRVQERTQELERAKDEAEKAVNARDEFLSVASHELRTPLTSLKLKTQMAQRRLAKHDVTTPEAQDFLKFIKDSDEQFKRIMKLVDDMLDLTRLTQGKLTLAPTLVDIHSVLENSIENLKLHFADRSEDLTYVGIAGLQAQVDIIRLEQVLNNLIINALKYAPGSEVKVTLEKNKNMACLKVSDAGPGIDPKDHEMIFRRYERVSPKDQNGLGIGLYLSKLIIEGLGGTIHLESELGHGATFVVKLPLV
jgi:PAS domain S-box-containing protein